MLLGFSIKHRLYAAVLMESLGISDEVPSPLIILSDHHADFSAGILAHPVLDHHYAAHERRDMSGQGPIAFSGIGRKIERAREDRVFDLAQSDGNIEFFRDRRESVCYRKPLFIGPRGVVLLNDFAAV